MTATDKYADIINMPRHVSKKHPHMSNYDRAAQFSPFAALTGHEAAVKETARLTDVRIELDEGEKAVINEKLQQIMSMMQDKAESGGERWSTDALPDVEVTFFQPDLLKEGGDYEVKRDSVKKIDAYRRVLIFGDFLEIKFDEIIDIKIFKNNLKKDV